MTTEPVNIQLNRRRNVPLEEKVEFLSSVSAYTGSVREVESMETHMSWVFLVDERAYKLKKPVKYSFLDFSTLSAREDDCREEVRLNRRLAPDVYLGVIPLALGPDDVLVFGDKGEVVDWLVKMRRLPAHKMLDHAIMNTTVTPNQINEVAELLARFYQALKPADLTPKEYVAHFAREQEKNDSLLSDQRFDLPATTLNTVLSRLNAVITGEPELLMTRARNGRVIEGHGDLRPEHVCLSAPPVIIDCLEFNRNFRLVDPFDELAFLSMECEHLGAPHIGETLFSRCAQQLGDDPSERLIAFYTAFRACLRARLALAHLLEPNPKNPGKWLPLAISYLAIAERASITLDPREAL